MRKKVRGVPEYVELEYRLERRRAITHRKRETKEKSVKNA